MKVTEAMGGKLQKIIIDRLKNHTYYASIYIVRDGVEIKIDARPSDAIALAVRFGVPIFVSDKVMEEAAFVPENEESEKIPTIGTTAEADKDKPKPKLTKLEQLQQQLLEAIAKEDYEKAARLRDEIQKLEARNF